MIVGTAVENLDRKWDKEDISMFSTERRRIAIETFIKYDHSDADTIAELGYPSRTCLRNWWNEYESTGEIPVGKGHRRKSEYTHAFCALHVRADAKSQLMRLVAGGTHHLGRHAPNGQVISLRFLSHSGLVGPHRRPRAARPSS